MKRILTLIMFLTVGTLLFQGFQCGSKEMNTAKSAYAQKNYEKATQFITQELKNNPGNEEALVLMAKIKLRTNDLDGASKAILHAEKTVKTKKYKDQVAPLKNMMWRKAHGGGFAYYNKYVVQKKNVKDTTLLDTALYLADVGLRIKPDFSDFYNLKARVLEAKGDTKGYIETFEKYTEVLATQVEFGSNNSVFIQKPLSEILSKFGTPGKTIIDTIGLDTVKNNAFFRQTEKFDYNGNELYVYLEKKTKEGVEGNFKTVGWSYAPPENWSDGEKLLFKPLQTGPWAKLAQHYYEKKDYVNSLRHLSVLSKIDPHNANTNAFLVQVRKESGSIGGAIKDLDRLTKASPDNELFWLQYADMLVETGKLDEAIEKYKKAIGAKPDYGNALFNISSTYKNKAANIQKDLQKKENSDPTFKLKDNLDKYHPFLDSSAVYFEKTLKTKKYNGDMQVYLQLAEIYQVLEKKELMDVAIAKLAEMEFLVPKKDKRRYYLSLYKIYNDLKDKKNVEKMQEKINELK